MSINPNRPEPKKLVLCFDGTGEAFRGSNADTNVVKILDKLDRNDPHQYFYYQTGIGTHGINKQSLDSTLLGKVLSAVRKAFDQCLGTTFDTHVMAGYCFLMHHYKSGDKIYMYGYSRGGLIAKFLIRMVNIIGLLHKGNEEMVPFVYHLYQRFLAEEVEDYQASHPRYGGFVTQNQSHHSHEPYQTSTDCLEQGHSDRYWAAKRRLDAFSRTFCRKNTVKVGEETKEINITAYFLGIWEAVHAISALEQRGLLPVTITGAVKYARHAVAIDERRGKLKAELISQDIGSHNSDTEVTEVWFPGCHEDVGGGCPAVKDSFFDSPKDMKIIQRVKYLWDVWKGNMPNGDDHYDRFQMSDIPLAWMINELEVIGKREPAAALKWSSRLDGFHRRFKESGKEEALTGAIHDRLKFGHISGFIPVLFWNLIEYLPIIKRWELRENGWMNTRLPLNKRDTRSIPLNATLHESLLWRLRNDESYNPKNSHIGHQTPCLKHGDSLVEFKQVQYQDECTDHKLYTFNST